MLDLLRQPDNASMWSLAKSILEPSWRKDEVKLFQMLPYGYIVNDTVISTRDGGLLAAAEFYGVNAGTLENRDFEYIVERFESVLLNVSPDISIYIHRINIPESTEPHGENSSDFASAVSNSWKKKIGGSHLRERKIILSAVIRPSADAKVKSLLAGGTTIDEERSHLVEELDNFFAMLSGTLGEDRVKRLSISDGKWLGFYNYFLTGKYHPVIHTNECEPISFNLPEHDITFGSKDITLHSNTDDEEDREIRVYSLKNYPTVSNPGIFDRLDLPVDIVITFTYLPIARAKISEAIRRRKGQMKSAGDQAVSLEQELGVFADAVASGNLSAGKNHMSIVTFGSKEQLRTVEKSLIGSVQIAGGTLHREGMSKRAIFFAQHPGNTSLRPREQIISNAAFADFVAFHMRPKGLPGNKLPWKAPLATMPTTQGEAYKVSLHLEKTSSDEENLTSGHGSILGPNGSGKTVINQKTTYCRIWLPILTTRKNKSLQIAPHFHNRTQYFFNPNTIIFLPNNLTNACCFSQPVKVCTSPLELS